jgi:hypothetical protein
MYRRWGGSRREMEEQKHKVHITKALVREKMASPPTVGQAFYRDDECKGFAFRVIPSGTTTFTWEGRIKGRFRRVTIGQFPDWTAERARKRAAKIRGLVADGKNPADERLEERREQTFGLLVQLYLDLHAKPKKKSWRRDEDRLKRHFGRFFGRRLSDISDRNVIEEQARIRERSWSSGTGRIRPRRSTSTRSAHETGL